jgi:iron complex transport system permease protein
MFWMLGSFAGVRWPEVTLSPCVVAIGLAVCIGHARALDAFTFGEDAARSLGIAVRRVRIVLLLFTALMTATLVSMVGAIGFVGLVILHAARFIVGPGTSACCPPVPWLEPCSWCWPTLSLASSSPRRCW